MANAFVEQMPDMQFGKGRILRSSSRLELPSAGRGTCGGGTESACQHRGATKHLLRQGAQNGIGKPADGGISQIRLRRHRDRRLQHPAREEVYA